MAILAGFMVPHPPMIVPQVGRGSEARVGKTVEAYENVAEQIAALKPETIILSSPHAVMYADYFHISPGRKVKGSFADFGAPEVYFEEEYDTDLVECIESLSREKKFPAGTMGERGRLLDHGTMVPLFFVRRKYQDFKLVRIGLSGLDLMKQYEMGQLIQKAVEQTGRRAVYIASGDLSHKLQEYGPYGFAPEGPQYDERIMDVCSKAAFGELLRFDENFCDKAAECGHRSFVMMAGAFDGMQVEAKQLSHEDVTGVGYGICSFYPKGRDASRHFLDACYKEVKERLQKQREQSDEYVKLARRSLESFIRSKKRIEVPADLPKELSDRQAGAFVSIHEHGRLRGCIGTILPTTDSVAQEIIQNAVSAATRDPRFDPVRAEELEWLEINVDVLGEPEDIASEEMLDVKRYGVIVTSGYKRGLLLPDLEGVDTVAQQIAIARQKGGIGPEEPVGLQRFEVVRHY